MRDAFDIDAAALRELPEDDHEPELERRERHEETAERLGPAAAGRHVELLGAEGSCDAKRGSSCSSAIAAASSVASEPARPTSWTPTGSPSGERPAGSESEGSPFVEILREFAFAEAMYDRVVRRPAGTPAGGKTAAGRIDGFVDGFEAGFELAYFLASERQPAKGKRS